MRLRDHHRPATALLATLAVVVGLAACGSSDASGDSTPAPTTTATTTAAPVATTPVTTEPATTVPDTTEGSETTAATAAPATEPTTSEADGAVVVTDAEVADLEKQLDEIDELLKGVDADLSQD